jgi:hypothetical protein
MKKVSLLLLIAAVALCTACPTDNRNGSNAPGGNKSAQDVNLNANVNGNVNANLNANTNPSLNPFNKEDKTVVIVVYDDPLTPGRRIILVKPDKLKLFKKNDEKLDFYVVNNLDDALTSLTINFTGPNGEPVDGAQLSFTNVPAGGAEQGRGGKIKDAPGMGETSYEYVVTATPAAGPAPTPLDPEIIINRAP